MTFFGISIFLLAWPVIFFMGMCYEDALVRTKRLMLERSKLATGKKKLHARLRAQYSIPEDMDVQRALQDRVDLPPGHRAEYWRRNVWGEPTDPQCILVSTGCELTDAIYAAAHRAKIDIVAFENELGGRV